MKRSDVNHTDASDAGVTQPALQCCLVCGRTLTDRALHDELEERVLASILAEYPEWADEGGSCVRCVAHYRGLLEGRLTREERLRELSRRRRPRWLNGLARWAKAAVGYAAEGERQMKGWKIALLLGLIVLIGAAFAGCSSGGPRSEAQAAAPAAAPAGGPSSVKVGTSVGDAAPDFRLAGLDGSEVKLADLRGQPAVLVFWTAWCPACKEEAPHINELAAEYEPRGVRVLGINIMDSPARAEGGVREFGIKYRVVRDADASVTRRYKVTGTPTLVFLDREGRVRYFGNELPADYASRLDTLVGQGG